MRNPYSVRPITAQSIGGSVVNQYADNRRSIFQMYLQQAQSDRALQEKLLEALKSQVESARDALVEIQKKNASLRETVVKEQDKRKKDQERLNFEARKFNASQRQQMIMNERREAAVDRRRAEDRAISERHRQEDKYYDAMTEINRNIVAFQTSPMAIDADGNPALSTFIEQMKLQSPALWRLAQEGIAKGDITWRADGTLGYTDEYASAAPWAEPPYAGASPWADPNDTGEIIIGNSSTYGDGTSGSGYVSETYINPNGEHVSREVVDDEIANLVENAGLSLEEAREWLFTDGGFKRVQPATVGLPSGTSVAAPELGTTRDISPIDEEPYRQALAKAEAAYADALGADFDDPIEIARQRYRARHGYGVGGILATRPRERRRNREQEFISEINRRKEELMKADDITDPTEEDHKQYTRLAIQSLRDELMPTEEAEPERQFRITRKDAPTSTEAGPMGGPTTVNFPPGVPSPGTSWGGGSGTGTDAPDMDSLEFSSKPGEGNQYHPGSVDYEDFSPDIQRPRLSVPQDPPVKPIDFGTTTIIGSPGVPQTPPPATEPTHQGHTGGANDDIQRRSSGQLPKPISKRKELSTDEKDQAHRAASVFGGTALQSKPKKVERMVNNTDYGALTKKLVDKAIASGEFDQSQVHDEIISVYADEPEKQAKAMELAVALYMLRDQSKKATGKAIPKDLA